MKAEDAPVMFYGAVQMSNAAPEGTDVEQKTEAGGTNVEAGDELLSLALLLQRLERIQSVHLHCHKMPTEVLLMQVCDAPGGADGGTEVRR